LSAGTWATTGAVNVFLFEMVNMGFLLRVRKTVVALADPDHHPQRR
jgi:hypothetical protein